MDKRIVHFCQRMYNEIHRRTERAGYRPLTHQTLVGFASVGRAIDKLLMINDDEHIEVRLIALHRMWFVHPVAPSIASKQDDLEDARLPLLWLLGERCGIAKLFKEDLHDEIQLASLRVWQVV